jgi:hypothetical protein
MKASRVILLVVVAAATLFTMTPIVSAQSAGLTDDQRDRIKLNCVTIKSTLTQLQANDALLRANRGQVYESMKTRLMDRFNSRLTSNSLDARGLSSLTKTYDERLGLFRAHYADYARQLDTALKIDCTRDPDAFHLAVANARTKRGIIHDDVKRLHVLIDDYRSSVIDFKTNFQRVSED